MNDCKRFERALERLLADELATDEHAWLLRHTEACRACEGLFGVHLDLSDPSLALTAVDEEDLLGVRRAVLRAIRHRGAEAPRVRLPLVGWWRPALAAGTAALLLAGGFVAGRAAAGPGAGTAEGAFGVASSLMREIDAQAARNVSLRDAVDSPFTYRNVQVRDAGGDRVALGFDVATRVDLVRPRADPLVAEVLVQAMLDDESLGARLQAVAQGAALPDPRVERALIESMQFDPSLPVRLRALAALASRAGEPAVQAAMMAVVAADESVQMRLLAIDSLTQNQVPREQLERAMESGLPGQRYAVYARAEPYLEKR